MNGNEFKWRNITGNLRKSQKQDGVICFYDSNYTVDNILQGIAGDKGIIENDFNNFGKY